MLTLVDPILKEETTQNTTEQEKVRNEMEVRNGDLIIYISTLLTYLLIVVRHLFAIALIKTIYGHILS